MMYSYAQRSTRTVYDSMATQLWPTMSHEIDIFNLKLEGIFLKRNLISVLNRRLCVPLLDWRRAIHVAPIISLSGWLTTDLRYQGIRHLCPDTKWSNIFMTRVTRQTNEGMELCCHIIPLKVFQWFCSAKESAQDVQQ